MVSSNKALEPNVLLLSEKRYFDELVNAIIFDYQKSAPVKLKRGINTIQGLIPS